MDEGNGSSPDAGLEPLPGEGEIENGLTPRRWGRPWQRGFLEALARGSNATMAARSVGMSHSGVYKARETDLEFAEAWDEAFEVGFAVLEQVGWRRGTVGEPRRTTRTIVRRDGDGRVLSDEVVTEDTIHVSDWLLWRFLQAHKPTIYGDRKELRVGGLAGGPVRVEVEEVYRWPTRERALELLRLAAELGPGEVEGEAVEEGE